MLAVSNVTKRFRAKTAVDNVSFSTRPGRILGLLGPNGAGKTTAIRMITYITTPDSGVITFDGKPVGPWSQRRMGYLPEERGLYRRMRVGEQLEYLGRLKGLSRHDARGSARLWLDRFGASDWSAKRVDELSKGMQQKIQFVCTVLHNPELLIFDEPFSGLDPINAELLQTVIAELKDEGRTILFASHRMEQVEQLCDDICMIADGRIVLDGSMRDIKRSYGRDTVRIEFDGTSTFLDQFESAGRIRVVSRALHVAELRLTDHTSAREILDAALTEVATLYRFEVVEPSLNEIFISVAGNAAAAGVSVA
jgi:ABC-2 type transport system ATP-binding protein